MCHLRKLAPCVVAGLLAGAFVGCFVPEEFTVTLTVTKDYRYTFEYEGTLVALMALESRAADGKVTPQDDLIYHQYGEANLATDPHFERFVYRGQGVWDVRWKKEGILGRTNYFFGKGMPLVTIVRSGNTIQVAGMPLTEKDAQDAKRLKARFEGTFELSTDCEIVSHNSPRKPTASQDSSMLRWTSTLENIVVPQATLTVAHDDSQQDANRKAFALVLAEANRQVQLGKTDEAINAIEPYLFGTHIDSIIADDIARFYARINDRDNYERVLMIRASLEPENPGVWFNLAQANAWRNRQERALAHLEFAFMLCDRRPEAADMADVIRRNVRTNNIFRVLQSTKRFRELVGE